VIEAIDKEGRAHMKRSDESLVDSVILAGAAATEHHEIAVYEWLICEAQAMGKQSVVALFEQNLEQEQHTLEEVKDAMPPDHAGDRTTGDLMATAADAPAAAVTVPTQDPMDAPSGGGVSRRSCQPFRPGAAGLRQTPWTPASDWLGWRASRYACIGAGCSLPR
jgi:Domain of unknown function (DUF892)